VLRPFASIHDVTRHVAQPPRQPVALHGRPDRSRNDQSKLRITCRAPHIDHQIRLDSPLPVFDRRIEIGRPRHAVPRGKHRCPTGVGYQAVSARRPLPRRFDTMARPALVRIRRRKPCTRARRRLFGWKVRLPFATTLSLLHLASCSTRFPVPLGHACPHDASVGLCLAWYPAQPPRLVLGSQPYRRLSGDCMRVLTGVRPVKPGQNNRCSGRRSFTDVTPAPGRLAMFHKALRMLQNGWPSAPKTVSFGQCCFRPKRR
jgi:hypothetical protein